MLHCWTAPAHPPLLQTNPSLERAACSPGSITSQTLQRTYKQPGCGPCQGQLGPGQTLSAVQLSGSTQVGQEGQLRPWFLNAKLWAVNKLKGFTLPTPALLSQYIYKVLVKAVPWTKLHIWSSFKTETKPWNKEILSFFSKPVKLLAHQLELPVVMQGGEVRVRLSIPGHRHRKWEQLLNMWTPQREPFSQKWSLSTSHLIMKDAFPPCLPTTSLTVPFNVMLYRNGV